MRAWKKPHSSFETVEGSEVVNVEVFDVVRKGSGHYLIREEVSEEDPLRAGPTRDARMLTTNPVIEQIHRIP